MKPFLICKRILSCFLITVILTVSCFVVFNKPVKTSANPIVIGGAVIAALGAFMASAGVTITNNGVQDGQGLQQMWENILHDFSYDNKALQDWYEGGNEIVNFIIGKENASKIAILSKEFATWLNEAKKWLVNRLGLNTNTTVPLVPYDGYRILIDGNFYPSYPGKYNMATSTGFDFSSNYPSTYLLSKAGDSFSFEVNDITYSGAVVQTSSGARFYYRLDGEANDTIITYNFDIYSGYVNEYDGRCCYCAILKDVNDYPYLVFCTLFSGGQYAMRKWWPVSGQKVDDAVAIGMEGSLTDGYSDFEQALEDSMTQSGTGEGAVIGLGVDGIPIENPVTYEGLTNAIIEGMLDNTLTGELVGGYENEKEAEEENEAETVPTVGEITDNIIKIDGIEDFFPFCIPFDLFHLIEKFNVAPVTPKFTGNLNFAGIFNNFEFDIDLTPFDTIASLFRIIFIIGFVIFLIIKTRDLIRG